MESTGELAWFRAEVVRSLLHPFDFAPSLAREHYGLAGVLVALCAGVALSITIDAMILTSKAFSLFDFLPQLLIDSVFLGVRLAVTVAIVATAGYWAARLLRGRDLTLDQTFTAFSFALSPLLVAPIAALLVLLAPDVLPIAGAVTLLVVFRAIVGLAINLGALLPAALVVVPFAVMLVTSALVMPDQVSRVTFAAYAIALATADAYADSVSIAERQGLVNEWRERSVVRINRIIVVDDRYGGIYEGRHVLYRQFTAVPRTQGLALIFHFVEPADEQAALAEAAAIAATWRIRAPSR